MSATFARHHGVEKVGSFGELLAHDDVDIVVNLTNPQSHFEINRNAHEAGRHVCCEKPLAMSAKDARLLGCLAAEKQRTLHSAPAKRSARLS